MYSFVFNKIQYAPSIEKLHIAFNNIFIMNINYFISYELF